MNVKKKKKRYHIILNSTPLNDGAPLLKVRNRNAEFYLDNMKIVFLSGVFTTGIVFVPRNYKIMLKK